MTTTVRNLLDRKGYAFYCVRPEDFVEHAVRMLCDHNVGALLVCEGDHLVGILSERDCVRRVMAKGELPQDVRVAQVMTAQPICAQPDDTITQCMTTMTNLRIRHLPVRQEQRVVGVVSVGDVVNAVLREQQSLIEDLQSYITGSPAL
jgi:CBS domain-containing protein